METLVFLVKHANELELKIVLNSAWSHWRLTSKGKNGCALAGLLLTNPAMMMNTTSSTCSTVATILKVEDSLVPRVRRNVRNKIHAKAHLQHKRNIDYFS